MDLGNGGLTSEFTRKRPDYSIISTKLHPPLLKTKMLHRGSLIDRLSGGRERPLTVITGMAGSGKTCLVCQWIARDNLKVAWYSLDKTDNESDVFFRYLLAGLRDVSINFSSVAESLLRDQERLSGLQLILLLIEHLVDLPEDSYLVLDDYHFIESPEIHEGLSYFLHHIPARMHVVITSRYSMPFALSHFRLRDQLTEISSQDLRLTDEEAKQFLEEVIPVGLSSDQVRELTRYAEGWVGGLQLLGLSCKGKELSERFGNTLSKACQETTDYLVDEVISVQPQHVKVFLQATALLDRFNSDLCGEVTGLTDAPTVLDHVYRNGLFLVSLDAEGTWYRYHHLFSDTIRRLVKTSSKRTFNRIQRKAALWFARNDYLEDALQHAFASDDFEFLADLLEDQLVLLYERSEIACALRWLEKIPHDVFLRRPLLRFQHCVLRMHSVQLSDVEVALKGLEGYQAEALQRYRGQKRMLSMQLLSVLRQVFPCYKDPAGIDTAQLKRLSEVVESMSRRNELSSVFARVAVARCHIERGDLSRAEELLRDVSVATSPTRNVWAGIIGFRLRADAERMQGGLRRSEATVSEALLFLERNGLLHGHLRTFFSLPLAWVSYFHNEPEKAIEEATAALVFAQQYRMTHDIVESRMALSFAHLANGQADDARRCAQEMQWASRATGVPYLIAFADAVNAYISVSSGDRESGERWLGDQGKATGLEFSTISVFRQILRAKILYHQGLCREAIDILEPVRERCLEQRMMQMVLDIDFFYPAVLYLLKARERARRIMEGALSLGQREGYVRPSIFLDHDIFPMLNEMARTVPVGRRSTYLTTVMSVSGVGINSAHGPSRNVAKGGGYLTAREIEILNLLVDGYKYREIADRVFISLDTVKTHARHIFGKLNVSTRTQAIKRADELQLLGKPTGFRR